ncbi:MAG: hypothetical protein A2600_05020 [Candidatus Lambdaproteobacteria bacterium RIFOXYD1_FULL_56_27]|uniref:Outer membrane protein beta-barrel domain-containing protein n=1 Tax=Candidatus Lambdaproteobacteria bacterium RIFOXYD2_FULL_56_26 TaxID=1817773 RepID=A0A1F6GRW1_9PROT|nr:MAG: hypothetical protein A2426_07875 [Candidatus Lambdaproteobacteria bacterium RIFOXYC1_FULL_56_13]OGH00820.1 MAG: hypothetical protein A2557_03865 [Candidatus Lambdaproteobacteria bacterium RIFOXYD2_FULL_56_26]OGH09915.1 MAG: hypothetical protein A2600_05020 [Candidatus Lambdaproteobacteria bacterium RIFOXYD1_FULL_56_27]
MNKGLLLLLALGLLGTGPALARDLEVGAWAPSALGFADSSLNVKSRTGGGLYLIFSSSFGIGVNSVGANLTPADASSDAPVIKHNLLDLSFTIPRKEGPDYTLGFGLGSVGISCATCAANYENGTSSELFAEARGKFWGINWVLGGRRMTGQIKGKILGAGNKVANLNADTYVLNLGAGLRFK